MITITENRRYARAGGPAVFVYRCHLQSNSGELLPELIKSDVNRGEAGSSAGRELFHCSFPTAHLTAADFVKIASDQVLSELRQMRQDLDALPWRYKTDAENESLISKIFTGNKLAWKLSPRPEVAEKKFDGFCTSSEEYVVQGVGNEFFVITVWDD